MAGCRAGCRDGCRWLPCGREAGGGLGAGRHRRQAENLLACVGMRGGMQMYEGRNSGFTMRVAREAC
jgi:hypothetical protein